MHKATIKWIDRQIDEMKKERENAMTLGEEIALEAAAVALLHVLKHEARNIVLYRKFD